MDRRGQKDAYEALCESYTKILKVDLTTDSFYIIKADEAEISERKGYSDQISQWMKNFAESGQVYLDDRRKYLARMDLEYLRNYFRKGYREIDIHYRRMTGGRYRDAKMELVRVKEYTDENQIVFLYVKTID